MLSLSAFPPPNGSIVTIPVPMRTSDGLSPTSIRSSPKAKHSTLPALPASAGPRSTGSSSRLGVVNDVDDGKRRMTGRRPRTAPTPDRPKSSFSFGFHSAIRRTSRVTMGGLPTITDERRASTEGMPPCLPSPETIPILPDFLTTDSLPPPPAGRELGEALTRSPSTSTTQTAVSQPSPSDASSGSDTPLEFVHPHEQPDTSSLGTSVFKSRPTSHTIPSHARPSAAPPVRTKSLNDLSATAKLAPPESLPQIEEPLPSAEPLPDRHVRDPRKWIKADDLIDRALYLAIIDTDPEYITHFLLTFRRFTTPRALLLGMQRRLRFLDNKAEYDPLFVAFSQMRLCALLARWMGAHPGDFAARSVTGALQAFVQAALSKSYLIHYAATFRPFMEGMSKLVDDDAGWAMKETHIADESEDEIEPYAEDDDELLEGVTPATPKTPETPRPGDTATTEDYPILSLPPFLTEDVDYPIPTLPEFLTRSRSPSPIPPSPAHDVVSPSSTRFSTDSNVRTHERVNSVVQTPVPPRLLQDLFRISTEISLMSPQDIAEELMAISAERFLAVQPRDWIRAALGMKKGDGTPTVQQDPVARVESFSNHVADFVASCILCHDKPRVRAKTMARLVEVAQCLRDMGNYAMLRAFVAGVNVAAAEGDATFKEFQRTHSPMYKLLLSYDMLLQGLRSHTAYRLALSNTFGACVPAIGIHMSDLIRTHEGNPDCAEDKPELVHWGKFAIFGKFVDVLVDCQRRCEAAAKDWRRPPRRRVRDLINNAVVLTPEMQFSRISPMVPGESHLYTHGATRSSITLARTYSPETHRRESVFRKLFSTK